MKILYDYLCFQEKYGGASKYFVKMLNCVSDEFQYEIAIKYSNNEYIKDLSRIKLNNSCDNLHIKGKWRLLNTINRLNAIKKFNAENFDIYHQTHYDPFAFKYLSPKIKVVMTLYDMNFFIIPEAYRNYEVWEWQKISAHKADKIITISNNSKNDIIKVWNIPEEKIEVVYLGHDDVNFTDYDLSRIFSEPYILFVGTRHDYKNFKNYLRSFKILSEKDSNLLFVSTGAPFNNSENKLISDLHLSDKVVQISASETMMVNLYRNAELFVYPSLYEGFGLPLLESMACHCPIVCSKTSCFPEIAGNAAKYFDPYSIENMFEVTSEVLNNPIIREDLVNRGLERIKHFTWQDCTNKHVRAYQSLI
jgi:glycosyltransferase involved in cell wall biosynthesis